MRGDMCLGGTAISNLQLKHHLGDQKALTRSQKKCNCRFTSFYDVTRTLSKLFYLYQKWLLACSLARPAPDIARTNSYNMLKMGFLHVRLWTSSFKSVFQLKYRYYFNVMMQPAQLIARYESRIGR